MKSHLETRLWKLIHLYASAYADMSWIGGRDPESHEDIKRELKESKRKLKEVIDEILTKGVKS